MSSSGFDAVPDELLDRICALNAGDIETTSASSRVSRRWRSVSLPYLFHTACLYCDEHFDNWRTIGHTMPYVLEYVREVKVSYGRKVQIPHSLTYDIDMTIPTLPNATSLHWNSSNNGPYATQSTFPVVSNRLNFVLALPAIRHLELSGNGIPDVFLLQPRWRSVVVLRLDKYRGSPFEDFEALQLRELRLHNHALPESMDWLVGKTPPPLKVLDLMQNAMHFPLSRQATMKLLRTTATTIEHVRIAVPNPDIAMGLASNSSLPHWATPSRAQWTERGPFFPVLRTLEFKVAKTRYLYQGFTTDWLLSWLDEFSRCRKLDVLRLSIAVYNDLLHFQNALTADEWRAEFVERVNRLRVRCFVLEIRAERWELGPMICQPLGAVLRADFANVNASEMIIDWRDRAGNLYASDRQY